MKRKPAVDERQLKLPLYGDGEIVGSFADYRAATPRQERSLSSFYRNRIPDDATANVKREVEHAQESDSVMRKVS